MASADFESENDVPNLDGMDSDELWQFHNRHQAGRRARELFPAGGRGTRSATADLANYAANKATAMMCRQRGDIPGAQMYEQIADRIYAHLPEYARW